MSGGSSRRYLPALRERAVRMVAEISDQHESEWAAMTEVARLFGGRDGRDGPQVGAPGSGRRRRPARCDVRGVGRVEEAAPGER
jgi:hypothetical protein